MLKSVLYPVHIEYGTQTKYPWNIAYNDQTHRNIIKAQISFDLEAVLVERVAQTTNQMLHQPVSYTA